MLQCIDVLIRDIQLLQLLFEDEHVIAICSIRDDGRPWLSVSIPELFGQVVGADRFYSIEGSIDDVEMPWTFLLVDKYFVEGQYFERLLSSHGPDTDVKNNPAIRYLREDVSLDELMTDDAVILFSVENSEQDVDKTLTLFHHYKPRSPRESPATYQVMRHGAFEDRQTPHRDWEKETVPMDAIVFVLVDTQDFEWEKYFKPDPRDEDKTLAWGDFPADMRVQEGVLFYFKGKVFGIGSRYQHLQHDGVVLDMAEIDLNGSIQYYHTRYRQSRWELIEGGDTTPMEFHEIYPQICLFETGRIQHDTEK